MQVEGRGLRFAPRFIGTTPPDLATLCKALTRCAKRSSTLVVYEAGPCGYGWARHLGAHGWRCEVISPAHITTLLTFTGYNLVRMRNLLVPGFT